MQLAHSGLGQVIRSIRGDKAHNVCAQGPCELEDRVVAFNDYLESLYRVTVHRCGSLLHDLVRIEEMNEIIDVLNHPGKIVREFW